MSDPEMYFNDFQVGDTFACDSYRITEDEIISFARQWDPQRFHVNPEEARESMFEGLVASGLHTLCICCSLAVEELFKRTAVMGGIGFDRVRYPYPVRPGDVLTSFVKVVDMEDAPDHPGGGYVNFEIFGRNEDSKTVISLVDLALIEQKEADH